MSERKDNDDFIMTLTSYLNSLINASKQGNMTSSLLWLGQINALEVAEATTTPRNDIDNAINKNDAQPQPLPLNLLSVEYIFRPHPNNRDSSKSALFHAALNGHYHLVEYYLSLYLVYAIRITRNSINTKQPFRTWFMQFNNCCASDKRKKPYKTEQKESEKPASFFSLADYDQCVIQSSEGNVRNVMIKKMIDLSYAMKVVDKASFSCVPYTTLIQPRMKQIYVEVKDITQKKGEISNYDDEIDSFSIGNNNGEAINYFSSHDIKKNDIHDAYSDSKSICPLVEKDYTIVRNPRSVLSIQYVDIEDDILAVEVKLQDRKYQEGTSLDGQNYQQSTFDSDENTLNTRETFATRASWLPSINVSTYEGKHSERTYFKEYKTKQALKIEGRAASKTAKDQNKKVRFKHTVGLCSSSSRHNRRDGS